MEAYDQIKAENHLKMLLKQYKIKVVKWSTTSSGWASWTTREVKIPKPTNIDRFGVCMHEVGHIIDGDIVSKLRFVQEFNADMFKLEQIRELGFDDTDVIKRVRWHSLSRIAMAMNRGFKASKIPQNIKDYFSDIGFSQWEGKNVYVSSCNNFSEINISISERYTKAGVEAMLEEKGLTLEMSESMISLMVRWLVNGRIEFDNLAMIVNYYGLNKVSEIV